MSGAKIKSGARAVADVERGVILAEVEIAAPPERVFRALTTAADITAWWGAPGLYKTTKYAADLRPGGRWRSEGVADDGSAFSAEGEFREVEPPRRIVQTWRADWDGGAETVVQFLLEPIEGGTRLTLRHDGFQGRVESCRGHAEGWQRVGDLLAGYLAAPSELRYFFCRLIPPRPTFAADLTADERALMGEHGQYWRRQLAEGSAVVFGPVGDPQGSWGLLVARAAGEAQLRALLDGDPVARSGRGFRFELLPMLSAVC